MNPGDIAQYAIWTCDEDNRAKIAWFKAEEAPRLLKESADEHGVILGPVSHYELEPGEGQAGHPDENAQGTNWKLLVFEAAVVAEKPEARTSSFLLDLDPKDLAVLRKATRKAGQNGGRRLTDAECDGVIEHFGPKVAERVLKDMLDAKD